MTHCSESWTGRRIYPRACRRTIACRGPARSRLDLGANLTVLGSDDVDKTVALVTENGGKVVRDAEDTPYGRLAAVADPTGAGFNLSSLD